MDNSYFATPEFLSISLHIISILALPLQMFGAYCIIWRSPHSMRSVKWAMLNLHIWSVLLDWAITILIIPFVLFPAVAGFSLGFLNLLGVLLKFQCYMTAVLLCTVNVAVFTLFENRYQLMFGRETFWEEIRKQLLAVNYVLAFLYPLPSFFRYPEQSSALATVLEVLPPLPHTILNHQINVYAIELRFFVIPIIFIIGMLGTEILTLATVTCIKMRSDVHKTRVSHRTLHMQHAILKAFAIRTIAISTNFFVPIIYICSTIIFNYHNQSANNFCFFIFALHGPISTSIMLWTHKPYRDVCSKLLNLEKSDVPRGNQLNAQLNSFRHS